VPYDLPFDQVDHVFGNIGGVVGNALEIARYAEQVDEVLRLLRLLVDQLVDFLVNRPIELVNRVVLGQHLPGQRGIPVDQRLQSQAQHLLRPVGHRREILRNEVLGNVAHRPDPLGNVDRQVADPFQIVVHLHAGDDIAQIGGHRLLQGQNLQAFFLDGIFHHVNGMVLLDHQPRSFQIAFIHRRHGFADAGLDGRRHLQHHVFQLVQLPAQMNAHRCHLPHAARAQLVADIYTATVAGCNPGSDFALW